VNTEAIESLQKIADNKHRIVHAVVHRSYGYNTEAPWYKDQMEKERIEIEKLNKEAAEIELIIKQLKNNDDEILSRAIEHYGEPAQVLKCIEELAELAEALVFTLNGGNRENIQYENIAFDMTITKTACKTATLKNTEVIHDEERIQKIVTEIADVRIVLDQLEMFLVKPEEVQEQINYKVKRLEQRIKEE
jgi:hypothetical protein